MGALSNISCMSGRVYACARVRVCDSVCGRVCVSYCMCVSVWALGLCANG